MGLSDQILETSSKILDKVSEKIEELFAPMATKILARSLTAKAFNPAYFKSPEGKAMAAKLAKGFGDIHSTPDQVLGVLAEAGLGEFSQLQVEAIIGKPIPNDAIRSLEVFKHIAIVQDATLITNILGIIGEFIPTTQLGQIGAELRSLMAASGMSQVSGLGMEMILQPLLQERIQKELFPTFTPKILAEGDILRSWIRGIITDDECKQYFGYLGYGAKYTDMMTRSSLFYPQGQDFVRFAVRDVFNPAAVASGGLMEQYPALIESYAAKAGMSPQVLQWYWAAHWELPSPNMGYEMLHRRIINQQQLKDLLKVADYAPGWIQPMIDISYTPLTRVDARNMLIDGTITEAEFVDAMRDLGYNELNATRLLKYVGKKTAPPQKDLTQAVMTTSYKLGLVSAKQFTDYLIVLGYDATEAALLLAIEDRKAEQDTISEKLEALKYQYANGLLDINTFVKKCAELGIPETKAQVEALKAMTAQISKAAKPSLTDIKGWLDKKQITKDRAMVELRKLGYGSDYVHLYLGEKVE